MRVVCMRVGCMDAVRHKPDLCDYGVGRPRGRGVVRTDGCRLEDAAAVEPAYAPNAGALHAQAQDTSRRGLVARRGIDGVEDGIGCGAQDARVFRRVSYYGIEIEADAIDAKSTPADTLDPDRQCANFVKNRSPPG